VNRLLVNDIVFPLGTQAKYDSENSGFYFQLLLELWLYNQTSQSFSFNNRFVRLWLNMTG
jgi:hypothetical protein